MSALRISYPHDQPRLVDLGPAFAAAASPIGRTSSAWGLIVEDDSVAVGVGPIEVRKATEVELARLDGPDLARVVDSIGLIPRPIRGQVTDAEKQRRTDLRASAKRGAEATRVEAIRRAALKGRGITDEMVADALRASGGNRAAASREVGLTESGIWRRVTSMTRRGVLPPDVASLLLPRGRWER